MFSRVTKSILLVALMVGSVNGARAEEHAAKPKVLEFYASWCAPCQQLKPVLERAKAAYGEEVEFVSYDVDDPSVRSIVEQYEVSPIPAVIFVDTNNKIAGYSIGMTREGNIQKGLNKIVPTHTAKMSASHAGT